jgi:glutamate 5-kinase
VVSRKRWIAGALEPRGAVVIDAGARAALEAGRSLLPAGVVRVEGAFDRGDAVIIKDADGRELGRGLIAYASTDAERLLGRKSAEIEGILGYAGRSEMIHRDDMALMRS